MPQRLRLSLLRYLRMGKGRRTRVRIEALLTRARPSLAQINRDSPCGRRKRHLRTPSLCIPP